MSDEHDVGGAADVGGGSDVIGGGGEGMPARSQYLGSAGRTALVRCGRCGRRLYLDISRWEWFGVALCGCRSGLLYRSLSVVTREEAEALARESILYAGELRALRDVEAALRRFLARYEQQPYWLWAPQTRDMVGEVRRAFRVVEERRARRAAGEAGPARLRELSGDEALALDRLAALPEGLRADLLAYLEVMCRGSAPPAPGGPADPDDAEMRSALERLEAGGGSADVGTCRGRPGEGPSHTLPD